MQYNKSWWTRGESNPSAKRRGAEVSARTLSQHLAGPWIVQHSASDIASLSCRNIQVHRPLNATKFWPGYIFNINVQIGVLTKYIQIFLKHLILLEYLNTLRILKYFQSILRIYYIYLDILHLLDIYYTLIETYIKNTYTIRLLCSLIYHTLRYIIYIYSVDILKTYIIPIVY